MGQNMSGSNLVQNWIKRILEDPITKILLENSNLTKIQLETLLIDILSEENMEKRLKYREKVKLRLKKEELSRGAFTRTLKQARRNVIQTVYTLFLLGYVGFLEDPTFDKYAEVAHNLKRYTEAYREVWERIETERATEEDLKVVKILQDELEERLKELVEPRTLSKKA
jgi:hypothetical protein